VTPLSHHEILRHVGPFTRAGHHVDLSGSDRAARTLAFKPLEHRAPSAPGPGQLTERLRLDLSGSAARLRRTVTAHSGLEATLEASGNDLAVLLERILAVPPEQHFRTAEGLLIADSYRCPDDSGQPLKLLESLAQARGLQIGLDARTVGSEPMSVTLTPPDPQTPPELPADLVAVLGRPWKLLRYREGRWTFLLHTPTREPERSTAALQRFAHAVTHLDRVLGDAPGAFHPTYRAARWRVWARRLTPLAIAVAMLASLPLIDRYLLNDEAGMNPLIFGIPNFLIIVFIYVSRHEMPTFTWPSFPQPLAPDAWRPVVADHDAATLREHG
jgi:hypothetical protein